jgi:uroporphyrinogen decarboxylase
MTHRERFIKALNHETPDRVPFYMKFCPQLVDRCERETGTRDFGEHFGFDFRREYLTPSRHQPDFARFHDHVPENARFSDWGMMMVPFPDSPNYRKHYPSMTGFTSVEQIETYPFPDVEADYRYEPLRAAARAAHDAGYAFGAGFDLGPIQTLWTLVGMDRFMMEATLGEPFILALHEKVMGLLLDQARQLTTVGADIIFNGDNFATQRGLMVSRGFWRDWYGPSHRRLIEVLKAADPDVKYYYHADGMMQELIPDMVEIGVDIIDPVQPECMDPAEIKKEYGDRIVISGTVGIQRTMPFGTPDDVKAEVRKRIETVGPGGGFLLAPTHTLPPEVPWENILAFADAAKTYGRYD